MIRTVLAVLAGAFMISSASADQSAVERARAKLEPYRNIPEFVAPGPAFDARACMQGKKVMSLPVSSANPFTKNINIAMKEVAAKVGFEFSAWENQGQPSQWVQAMNHAVNNGYDLVDLLGGTDPRVLLPQINEAVDAGLEVVVSHYSGFEQPAPTGVTGVVAIDYYKAGELLADWVIMNTGANANVLVVVSNEIMSTESVLNGIKDEFDENCENCRYRVKNVPVPDWSTKIQPTVQAELLGDPAINYIIPIYDSMSQFVVPALTITGRQDSVKVATFNGTPFVIGLIQQGRVEMDIGENLDWIGHAIMDAEMRILCGLAPVSDPKIPFMIFEADNAHTAGTPPKLSTGYGDAYVEGYRALWMLDK